MIKISRILVVLGLWSALMAGAVGQTTAVPVASEPHHHKAFENKFVRVYKVEVPPHGDTQLHKHAADYIWMSVGASQITNAVEGKPPVDLKLVDGQTVFAPAPVIHVAKNLANTPFKNLTIELLAPKKDDPAKQAEARGLEAGHGAAVETLFLHDGVLVRDVILNPQAMLPMEQKAPPRLVLAVNDIKLRDHGNAKRAIDRQAGDFAWVEPGPSMLVNLGDKPAHFVMLDFQ